MVVKLKYVLVFVLFGFLSYLYSCERGGADLPNVEDCENYYYEDCNTVEPFEGNLTLIFSINQQVHSVTFEVYKGNVDDGNLFFSDTSWNSSVDYIVPTNEYYSVKATYQVNGKQLHVIDGGSLRKFSRLVCDSTCWAVDDLSLDLSIQQ
ncbi:MAG: hypothetical protein DRI84_03630 [Bacteroidetes bacterium]|nr:MAG: hypothetical protein DRI84_03630 [Bacteroidota bacterium]